MRFTIEQRIDAPIDTVHAALLDRDFLAASSELPKIGNAALLDEQRDGNRVTRRIRYRFTGELSSAVTAVVNPEKLTWIDESTDDLVAHTSDHRIVPDHYADRFTAEYRSVLRADGSTTTRTVTGEVKIRMPLVGGRVEKAIVSGLEEHAEAEAALVEQWIQA